MSSMFEKPEGNIFKVDDPDGTLSDLSNRPQPVVDVELNDEARAAVQASHDGFVTKSDEALQAEIHDETFEPAEGIPDIPLERCDLHFILNLKDVSSLADALDIAAVSLGRYGMDAFYVLATDPDTDRQWVIQGGVATTAEEELATLNESESEDEQPTT